MISSQQIETLLKLGALGDNEARRRALILADDIEQIGFDTFQLSCRPYPVPSANGQIVATPLAEYQFGDTGLAYIKLEIRMMTFRHGWGGAGLDRAICSSFRKFRKSVIR